MTFKPCPIIGSDLLLVCEDNGSFCEIVTFVTVFTIKSPWRLTGEDTEQMYSKHLSV